MPHLLLEIGTEELPASAVTSGEGQLRALVAQVLADARIRHGEVRSFATARRLAVLVHDVADVQDPAVEERRGPPVSAAYDSDGNLAPAAVGFARAAGFDPSQLVRKQSESGEYLFAVRELAGQPSADVLPGPLSEAIGRLSFPKAMRWDRSKVRFPRPVRWLVCLLGEQVLSVRFGELEAGRTTTGHRVFHPGPLDIGSPDLYEQALRDAGVVASRDERRSAIREQARTAAQSIGGRPIMHPHVLDEVTDLVEQPAAATGRFDPEYLKLPREVLVTSMESHQRYFPVEDADGQLLPGFVVIGNADPANEKTIAAGNERVLRARLEDARFFAAEDAKVSLAERAERLSEMVFHSMLGSMRDKVLRLGALLGKVVRWLGVSDDEADAAFFAADLCKADLHTLLVHEFPELQGAIGRHFAQQDTELGPLAEAVGRAIYEHYLPRTADDELPSSKAGVALGLTDRLDTLVGYVGIGEAPTGSEDPFALRRQATGFAAVSIAADARLPLRHAIAAAHEEYVRQGVELGDTIEPVRSLIVSRAIWILEREGIRRSFIDAAAAVDPQDLPDLASRARAVRRLHANHKLHGLAVAHERCFNIAKGGPHGDVDPSLLGHESEQDLYAQLEAVEVIAAELAAKRDYAQALEALVALSSVVDVLFDRDQGVMIMDPDEAIRRNRQALCERTARVFRLVAAFENINPKDL